MKIFQQITFFLALFFFSSVTAKVWAGEKVTVNFFYSNSCPHCHEEQLFLDKLSTKYPEMEVAAFEVSENRNNAILFKNFAQKFNLSSSSVPLTIIGNEYLAGFADETSSGAAIESKVESSIQDKNFSNLVANLENEAPQKLLNMMEINHGKNQIRVPFLGQINPRTISLPVLTLVIGLLDGFNPCAMWTLVFLVSLLLGLQNKKRMWLLGSVFILVSGFVYFLFMSAWLNLFLFIGLIFWVRLGIGVFALGAGIYNLRDYWINKDGACKVEKSEQKKATFAKIRDIIQRQSIVWALLGIVILAGAVNLVELLCSAGLPAVYTQVLALNNLPWWQYYTYLILYIFFYMLDDLVVFAIAMKTLNLIGIDHKYARYSRLIGGIVILVIGILMLFKPGWLSFAS